MTEIDFAQLYRDGTLDAFIDDLRDLAVRQQDAVDKYKHRKFLAPILGDLQKKVNRWHALIETAVAFRNSFHAAKK